MLLDSWKIRRTGFWDIGLAENYRPYKYQLPTAASTSEHNTPTVITSDSVRSDELFTYEKYPEEAAKKLPVSDSLREVYLEDVRARQLSDIAREEASRLAIH